RWLSVCFQPSGEAGVLCGEVGVLAAAGVRTATPRLGERRRTGRTMQASQGAGERGADVGLVNRHTPRRGGGRAGGSHEPAKWLPAAMPRVVGSLNQADSCLRLSRMLLPISQ